MRRGCPGALRHSQDGSDLSTAQATEALDQARADREARAGRGQRRCLVIVVDASVLSNAFTDAAYLAVAEIFGCALVSANARLARVPDLRCEVRVAQTESDGQSVALRFG